MSRQENNPGEQNISAPIPSAMTDNPRNNRVAFQQNIEQVNSRNTVQDNHEDEAVSPTSSGSPVTHCDHQVPVTPPRTFSLHLGSGEFTSDGYDGIHSSSKDEEVSPKDISSPQDPMASFSPSSDNLEENDSVQRHLVDQKNYWPSYERHYSRKRITNLSMGSTKDMDDQKLLRNQPTPRQLSLSFDSSPSPRSPTSDEMDDFTLPWPYATLFEPLQASKLLFLNVFSLKRMLLFLFLTCGLVALMTMSYVWPLWDPERLSTQINIGIVNQDTGFGGRIGSMQFVNQVLENQSLGDWTINVLNNTTSSDDKWKYQWVTLAPEVSREKAIDAVDRSDYWAILYIPSNFSTVFLNRLDGSTQTTSRAELIYDEARQWNVAERVRYRIQALIHERVSLHLSEQILSRWMATNVSANASKPIVTRLIQLEPLKIHEPLASGQYSSNYRVLLILWLGSLFSVVYLVRTYGYWIRQMVLTTTHHTLTTPGRIMISIETAGLLASILQASIMFGALYLLGGDKMFTFQPGVWLWMHLLLAAFTFFALHLWVSTFLGPEYIWVVSIPLLMFQVSTSPSLLDPEQAFPFPIILLNRAFPFTWALNSFSCLTLGSGCRSFPINMGILGIWCVVSLGLAHVMGLLILRRFRKRLRSSEEAVVFGRRALSTSFI